MALCYFSESNNVSGLYEWSLIFRVVFVLVISVHLALLYIYCIGSFNSLQNH